MNDRREIAPFDTTWLYRESIEEGAPEWLLVAAAREIERLQAEVNGLRKAKRRPKSLGPNPCDCMCHEPLGGGTHPGQPCKCKADGWLEVVS